MAKTPKTPHCSNKHLKSPSISSSPVEISDSSYDKFPKSSSSKTKKPCIKKLRFSSSIEFNLEDLQLFWGSGDKSKFITLKDRPFAHGQIIYLEQLEKSHCPENCQDFGKNSSLPYGMMISRILKASGIDLSKYPAKEVSSAYHNRAFASMGYILSEEKWHKKAGFKPKLKVVVDKPQSRVTSNVVQSILMENLLKDVEEIKASEGAIVDNL
ncbi:hypothetical protein HAX54_037133 [Datura stramonium]|uniref:Uncharacterized protein n=1 Tax=Datura stramonium TaxID=4076 RepID=A0ABS8VJ41_DATST|nr:hypothetical protein [Datura stramonium]